MSLRLEEPPTTTPFDADHTQPQLRAPAPPAAPGRARQHGRGWLRALLAALAGVVFGVILGAIAMLLALALLAPQPVAPRAVTTTATNLSLTVDDAYLTTTVSGALAHAALPTQVTGVRVHIAAGNLVDVSGMLPALPTFPGQPTRRFVCALVLTFDGTHLTARVASFTVGALTLPASLTQGLELAFAAQLPQAAAALVARSPFTLAGVTTASGALTLALRTR